MFKPASVLIKSDEEIELMRASNMLVSRTLALVAGSIKPGVTGLFLDRLAEDFIRSHSARPAFKGFNGFPGSLCLSVNAQVVHGIPSDYALQPGDVISVDCGVELKGFYGDCAFTFALQGTSSEVLHLLSVTRTSLKLGVEQVEPGNRIGDISQAIQDYTERKHGYGVVRELVGHGIGRNLHEPPEVPNFGRRGQGPILKKGMAIAIEPMINMGSRHVKMLHDGWTIVTRDLKPSAHFEHSVALNSQGRTVLSDHSLVDEAIKNNPEVLDIPELS